MISARLEKFSKSEYHDKTIATFVLEYPRFIHSELMTHRVFSRNAASSRAIPVKKMLEMVIKNPARPIHWGANKPGMQASEELTGWQLTKAKLLWDLARWPAVAIVWLMSKIGLHKQVANRLLEPWMHMQVVLTATERGNFYNLRYHPAAQPEIQELARLMWEAEQNATPDVLDFGEWHLPFISISEKTKFPTEDLLKMSVARCARVSYLNHEGKTPSHAEDMKLYARLLGDFIKHASPAEHQATTATMEYYQSGNFCGWHQYRKGIHGENLPKFEGLVNGQKR